MKKSKTQECIEDAAAQWVGKHYVGLDAAQQDEFFEWLAADPRHSEAFAECNRLWKNMDNLVLWAPEHSSSPNGDLLNTNVWHRVLGWKLLVSGAATVLGLVVLTLGVAFFTTRENNLSKDYTATTYQREELPDKSVLELKGDSKAKVVYTSRERTVELLDNEAHFIVAHDPDRPFVVKVGNVRVRAIGTAFNVRKTQEAVDVVVTEGKVIVEQIGETAPDSSLGAVQKNRDTIPPVTKAEELEVGQATRIAFVEEPAQPIKKPVSIPELNERLDWKPPLYQFDGVPLVQVVSQFNAENRVQILLASSALESLSVSASLRSSNPYHLVELLEIAFDIEADHLGNNVIVLRGGDDG